MIKKGTHLVVGAAGMIGSAIVRDLISASEKVVGADLWRDNLGSEKIFVDLADDPAEWKLPQPVKTAYLCAGVTKIEECRRDPTVSSRVNVEGTIRLAETMLNKGTFTVFLSSNQVFDGTMAKVPPHHPQNPQNEYGRQKTVVEQYLNQWPERAAIIRLTKIVGPKSIFFKWAGSLRQNLPIHPFTDMVVSPVPLLTVASIVSLIGMRQLGGIWQISGEKDVTYAEAAQLMTRALGTRSNLVRPFTTREANLGLEFNPAHTTLDTERLIRELGLAPPSIESAVGQV